MADAPSNIEAFWRVGRRAEALALAAQTSVDGEEALAAAEALMRVARDFPDADAEQAVRLAVKLRQRVWPPGHAHAAYAAAPLADFLDRKGRTGEAEEVLKRAEALALAALDADNSDPLRDAVFARAKFYLAHNCPNDAEKALLRAAEIEAAGRHARRPPFTLPLVELGALYQSQQRHAEAAEVFRSQLAIGRRTGMLHHEQAIIGAELGRSHLRAGDVSAARLALTQAVDAATHPLVDENLITVLRELLQEASRQIR
jgi:tetratricopeptide (TPR) repeat protein